MNFHIAANDDTFAQGDTSTYPFPRKTPKTLPLETQFRLNSLGTSLINDDIPNILEHCEGLYKILLHFYGDDDSIPVAIIDYIYPYSNTDLSLEVRLAMITFLFNKHPNKKYYQSLKKNAEQLNANGTTVEEISQRIKNQVSNNLARWRALSWKDKTSPFEHKKRVA